ncbi:MAG: hypothetical protein KatS3mg001_443 [Candidatus Pacearchaeota archaeon]|nr:MAG: hypothetical protein KatS3mg001_443 [Candidatus Pacearchaeota archaeon]
MGFLKFVLNLIFFIFFIFIFLEIISSYCQEGQIDINSASIEELDKIIWVGPATAEKIIAARPFNSLDELIKVSGIGEKKLSDIKEEGLACVNQEKNKEEKINEKKENNTQEISSINLLIESIENNQKNIYNNKVSNENQTEIKYNIISLSPKTIKTDIDNKKNGEELKMIYFLILFGVMMFFLIIIKRKRKNEF